MNTRTTMPARLLLTGASGHLGAYLLRRLQRGPYAVTAWSGSWQGELFGCPVRAVDLTDREQTTQAFRTAQPDFVLHCAALASVADCHRDSDLAKRVNHEAAGHLAEQVAGTGGRLLHISTDLVFDGEHAPYREEAEAAPLSVYGCSKWAGEQAVLAHPGTLVVRVSLLLGPSLLPERPTFLDQQIRTLRAGQPIRCFVDEWRTPLGLEFTAKELLHLLRDGVTGLLHLGGPERLSRWEIGLRLARRLGVREELVQPIRRAELPTPEPRPRDTSLDSSRWCERFPDHPWPAWDEATWE